MTIVVFAVDKEAQQQLAVIAAVGSIVDLTFQARTMKCHHSGTWVLAYGNALLVHTGPGFLSALVIELWQHRLLLTGTSTETLPCRL